MPVSPQPEVLVNLQRDLEGLIRQLRHPVLVEGEVALMDLTAAQWRLTVEFGKLMFTAWNSTKSISRRIEAVAYRDRDRFGVFVSKPGGAKLGHWSFAKCVRRAALVGEQAERVTASSSSPCSSAITAAGNLSASATAPTASTHFPHGTHGDWQRKAGRPGRFWASAKRKESPRRTPCSPSP